MPASRLKLAGKLTAVFFLANRYETLKGEHARLQVEFATQGRKFAQDLSDARLNAIHNPSNALVASPDVSMVSTLDNGEEVAALTAEIAALTSTFAEEKVSLAAAHENDIARLKTGHDEELRALQTAHEGALRERQQATDMQVRNHVLEMEQDGLKANKAETDYARQITDARRKFNAEMDVLMQQHADKKAAFADDAAKSLHTSESMHREQMGSAQAGYDLRVKQLHEGFETKFEKDKQRMEEEHVLRINNYAAKIRESEGTQREQINSALSNTRTGSAYPSATAIPNTHLPTIQAPIPQTAIPATQSYFANYAAPSDRGTHADGANPAHIYSAYDTGQSCCLFGFERVRVSKSMSMPVPVPVSVSVCICI